jgi:voltage-gated sodium channel
VKLANHSPSVPQMVASGPRLYLKPNWNKLDTALAVVGMIDFMVLNLLPGENATVIGILRLRRLFRLLRVLRLLRILRTFRNLTHLVLVLKTSQQGLWHVGTVVFFVFYIYAYLGVLIFGKVRFQRVDTPTHSWAYIATDIVGAR